MRNVRRVAAAAEQLGQDILGAREAREVALARAGPRAWPGPRRRPSLLGEIAVVALARPLRARRVDLAAIEARALLRVAQQIVGGTDVLEFPLRILVPGIEVGVQLLREPAIGLLDFRRRRVALDAQHLVGIARAHEGSSAVNAASTRMPDCSTTP